MADNLISSDWQDMIHGGRGLKRIVDTFEDLNPDNKPYARGSIAITPTETGTGAPQDVTNTLGIDTENILPFYTVIPDGGISFVLNSHSASTISVTVTAGTEFNLFIVNIPV